MHRSLFSHAYLSGARKLTSYIRQYIMENYEIPDRSQDMSYIGWNDTYRKYSSYKWDTLLRIVSLISKFLLPFFLYYITSSTFWKSLLRSKQRGNKPSFWLKNVKIAKMYSLHFRVRFLLNYHLNYYIKVPSLTLQYYILKLSCSQLYFTNNLYCGSSQ